LTSEVLDKFSQLITTALGLVAEIMCPCQYRRIERMLTRNCLVRLW
jgi:hypothetical protein